MIDFDNSFDFDDYREGGQVSKEAPKPVKVEREEKSSELDKGFDFDDYREPTAEADSHPYALQYAHLTPKQYAALPPEEKKRLQEYSPLEGLYKGVLKGVTLGASEEYPLASLGVLGYGLNKLNSLKVKEEDIGAGAGELIGETAPLTSSLKALSLPLKAIPKTYKYTRAIYPTVAAAVTGSSLEAGKEAIKGEELSPWKIGIHGALFGLFDAVVRGAPVVYKWLKDLNPAQQAELLVEGAIPKDLPPTSYKFYQDEVVPRLQQAAEEEYASALETAVKENDAAFEQKMSNVRAQHEKEMYELAQKKQVSQEEAARYQEEYQNKVKQIAAEHESELEAINKENEIAMAEYEKSKVDFERTKTRQEMVENTLSNIPQESSANLQGKVSARGEDIGVRPPPGLSRTPLEDEVGSIISKDRITNTYNAGQKNIEAVRATDKADYDVVKKLYNTSEELNESVIATHENLANDLRANLVELEAIPDPTPHQKQLISTTKKLLNTLIKFGEDGQAIGFNPVSNKVLMDQAKALRHSIDFDFSHGNSSGIFKPTIGAIENSVEEAAISVGNKAAVEANKAARQGYKEWAELYQNKFIRNYRSKSNHRFSRTFKNSLNVDDYLQLDKVLSRTNAGQQVSAQTRRALVEKKLKPFLDNPRKMDKRAFNQAIEELRPVLKPGEEQAIRGTVDNARRTSGVQSKKIKEVKAPLEPKKRVIESVNIPLFKPPKANYQEPTSVKIPVKPEVKPTPAMKTASKKMKITPEEIGKMTGTPTGLKDLRKELLKKEGGERVFNEIGQNKIKEILFEGNVKREFTGGELYNIINKGNNFDIISEIMGKEAATDLLESAAALGKKKVTADMLKKYAKKLGTVKAAMLFGIL
jgi:hypothetical protein